MRVNKAPVLSHREKEYVLGGPACNVCILPKRRKAKDKCDACPENRFRNSPEIDIALEAGNTRTNLLGC